MARPQPSVLSVFVLYAALLMLTQLVLWNVLATEYTYRCRGGSYWNSRPTQRVQVETFYFLNDRSAYPLITAQEYNALCVEDAPDRQGVMGRFIWTEDGAEFPRWSLWHLSDRSRHLQFFARSGAHGEHPWQGNDTALRQSVANQTGRTRYLTNTSPWYSTPVISAPLVSAKLLAHALLVLLAYRMSLLWRDHVAPRWRAMTIRDPNACPHCGYDCRELPSPTCPECGHEHGVLA